MPRSSGLCPAELTRNYDSIQFVHFDSLRLRALVALGIES